jgi:APA family basic amino acid/polyamine antiporter
MIFGRIKPLDAILATAEKKGLQRSLGPVQLTLLGVGAVIGTGIFVLTSEAAQKAGPGMMISFIIAGFVCAVAALCYAELSAMVPVAGSAYTYTYAVVGELFAWMVGWALILEYAVGASAVAVGWSGYFVGQLRNSLGIAVPDIISNGDALVAHIQLLFGATPTPELLAAVRIGGWINLPAVVIALLVTWLLMIGTTESARVNAVLVAIKVAALTLFVALTLPILNQDNFEPFIPNGWGTIGVVGAASSIFFAYVGFDAVSTAAEETRNTQRNVPIGLIRSLLICNVFYQLVSAGAIGAIGAQPVTGLHGEILSPGSPELAARCAQIVGAGMTEPLACSREALAHVLRVIGWSKVSGLIGLAAFLALPSVVLMMMFGQTRIFFVMARDGLLPEKLATVHPRWKTPYIVTIFTGIVVTIAAAFLPVGRLADYSNSGTLFAFMMVAVSVLVLRRTDPTRHRPFRTPAVWLVAPLAIVGCIGLYAKLPLIAILVLPGWGVVGLLVYFLYSRKRSHVGRGVVDVPETEISDLEPGIPATE